MNISFFKNMQKELTIFLLCIVISTTIIVISHSVLQSSIENKTAENNALISIKQRYYTAIERRGLLETFETRFTALQKSKIAGEEDRLSWVDSLSNIAKNNKISYLKYKIDKQEKISSNTLSSSYPDIDVFKSTMTLNMQLLHEGDLYTILNKLDKTAKGLFDVQSCTIAKNLSNNIPLLEKESDKNFASVCVLNWYTMQKKTNSLPVRRSPNV